MSKPAFYEGQLTVFHCWPCNAPAYADSGLTQRLAVEICERLNLSAVGYPILTDTPPGFNVYLPILESHISIDVWPESQAVVVDVFSCKAFNLGSVIDILLPWLQCKFIMHNTLGGRNGFFNVIERSSYEDL